MKNWFKNLFTLTDDTQEEASQDKMDTLEDVLYKKRQRIKESNDKQVTIVKEQREDFIEVKQRKNLSDDIIETLQKNGIEAKNPKQSKIRQLSQRSQQISEEVEQLGETVYRRHRSTRKRSKFSISDLNEDVKKVAPSAQSTKDDIFGIFPAETTDVPDIVVEIADEYINKLTSNEIDRLSTKDNVYENPENQQVEATYTKLTETRKTFMEEFGPKSDDEVPYFPKYKGRQQTSTHDLHHAQHIHRAGFKPTTHFSAIHGVNNTTTKTTSTKTTINEVEYSSTGKIIKSSNISKNSPKINGVDEPKTIAGLKQVDIKPPLSSHIPTSAISVNIAKEENKTQVVKEKPKREIITPYNVLSSVEERARLRKLKRLGR